MSNAQLRQALVGKRWTNNSPESTAYDSRENPFWPQPGGNRRAGKSRQGGSVSGNREVLIRYHTGEWPRPAGWKDPYAALDKPAARKKPAAKKK